MSIESNSPVVTDTVIDSNHAVKKMDYLFVISDAAERNVLTALLKEKKKAFESLDYVIVFSGASLACMKQEPFASLSKEKIVNINDLDINECIDTKWDRKNILSSDSIKRIVKVLQVQKAVITGASQGIFEQIHSEYKTCNPTIRRVAIWENPNKNGNTTYFSVGLTVAKAVSEILVPSEYVAEKMRKVNEQVKVAVVGVPTLEDFEKQAKGLDKEAIYKQVGFNSEWPIIVISGATDSTYTPAFTAFINMLAENNDALKEKKLQLIVQPHPSYSGTSEKELCRDKESDLPISKLLISSSGKDDATSLTTLKALAIADIVVCTDPTSLVVFQAASIGTKVLLFNPEPLRYLKQLISKGILERVQKGEELIKILKDIEEAKKHPSDKSLSNVYKLMGIPKEKGFEPFWNALIGEKSLL